jgi:hypothetical protein
MNNDKDGVTVLDMIANQRVVGEDESPGVLEDFDENGLAV